MGSSSFESVTLTAPRKLEYGRADVPAATLGTVIVRAVSVGLCGSDALAYRGDHSRMKPPLVMGHEFSGEVLETGSEVSHLQTGDRVAVDPVVSCGNCPRCTEGRDNICREYRVIGARAELPGALQHAVRVDVNRVHRIPDSLSFDAAAVAQPLAVSYHAVRTRGRAMPAERILVVGAGPIGLGCVMVAKALGADVTVVDLVSSRLELAAQFGADATVDGNDTAVPADAFDLVIEAVGGRRASTLKTAARAVRPGGRAVVAGNFVEGAGGFDAAAMKTKEAEVLGSQSYSAASYKATLDLVARGVLQAEAMISHRFEFAQTAEAFELLDDDKADKGKIVVCMAR